MPFHLLPITRRRFLSGSATAIASLSLKRRELAAEVDSGRVAFSLLSDTHLMHPDTARDVFKGDQKKIDSYEKNSDNLKSVLKEIAASPRKYDGLILNGDCVHDGYVIGYPFLTQLMGSVSEKQMPVHFTLGNHDNRANFLGAISAAKANSGKYGVKNRYVSLIKGELANWFLLDTLQEKKVQGRIGSDQLRWLRTALDANADKPAFVMAHHNINPSEAF